MSNISQNLSQSLGSLLAQAPPITHNPTRNASAGLKWASDDLIALFACQAPAARRAWRRLVPVAVAGLLTLGLLASASAQTSTWTDTSQQYGPVDMGVDSSENMFTAGSTEGPPVYGETISYDYTGTVRWHTAYSGFSATRLYGVAPDGSGGCVSVGNTYTTPIPYQSIAQVALIVKYNSSGNQSWSAQLGGTDRASDAEATAVVMDSSGNVYVTGRFLDTTTGEDAFVAKYNSSGSQMWMHPWYYSSSSSGSEGGNGIALDSSNNVYVSVTMPAVSIMSVTYTGALLKYNSSGTLQWSTPTTGNGSKYIAAASASSHLIYVANGSVCQYYDNGISGSFVWDSASTTGMYAAGNIAEVVVDSSDEVFGVSGGTTLVTTGLNTSTGAAAWQQPYSGYGRFSGAAHAIAVDNNGHVYVTGNDSGLTTVVALKFTTMGGTPYVYTGSTYSGSGTFALGIGSFYHSTPIPYNDTFVLGGTPSGGYTNILAIGLSHF